MCDEIQMNTWEHLLLVKMGVHTQCPAKNGREIKLKNLSYSLPVFSQQKDIRRTSFSPLGRYGEF